MSTVNLSPASLPWTINFEPSTTVDHDSPPWTTQSGWGKCWLGKASARSGASHALFTLDCQCLKLPETALNCLNVAQSVYANWTPVIPGVIFQRRHLWFSSGVGFVSFCVSFGLPTGRGAVCRPETLCIIYQPAAQGMTVFCSPMISSAGGQAASSRDSLYGVQYNNSNSNSSSSNIII